MKKIALIIIVLFISNYLDAQSEEPNTDDTSSVSGFISPFFATTNMVKPCNFIGGTGALFLNKNIFFGGFGMSMMNYFKTDRGIYSGNELDLGCGGLMGGFVFYPSKKIHPVFTIWAGGGSISLSDNNKTRIKEAFDDFLFFNGTLEIEYRPINNLTIGIGGHYQILSGVKLDGYSENNFCGPGLYANIKVGVF